MNYIKQLQQENQELKNTIQEIDQIILDLYRYLSLPKFHEDNHVNTRDIYLRLDPAKQAINF